MIYLDYNATTPIDPKVAKAILPFLLENFGNPSSSHSFGLTTQSAVEKARKQVAKLINTKSENIIFTSGGTESNNFAIKGVAFANRSKGNHIIISEIEHPAVTEVCQFLAENGFEISKIPADKFGLINLNKLENTIKPTTILISVMHANNEIGTIQPIDEIGEIAKKNNIIFHTDAAQSLGKITVDVQKMKVDLLSIAGHKIYAPKGIGALYIRENTHLQKQIYGANQENNLRAGTENVMGIVGLGEACELVKNDFTKNYENLKFLRNKLHKNLAKITNLKLNGYLTKSLPNTLNVTFVEFSNPQILEILEKIAVSTKAACHSNDRTISAVLKAIKITPAEASKTIRFSVGKMTTECEIDEVVKIIMKIAKNNLT
ncbi:MAG: cysteine desulfurase [Candidatus Cloacimonetes bacterium]|jgi:cysteine desulfurase|nr:cysteine desulfurase [Candidatus Cloacimonadota bacterium]MBT6994475.1 cysteine desulfurase [Candidatus Cloacimonadota bacterium]MBT7469702.1 cysteine desulfurase [Candidatus Cloacimonadota bacterium]